LAITVDDPAVVVTSGWLRISSPYLSAINLLQENKTQRVLKAENESKVFEAVWKAPKDEIVKPRASQEIAFWT